MIDCYVIDDESHAIDLLVKYIGKVPDLRLAGSSTDPLLALRELVDNHSADAIIVFLDVDMPELTGIELAELLPANAVKIFVTAFSDYALKAFDANAADFLLKPVAFTKFLRAVEKAKTLIAANERLPAEAAPDAIFINPGVKGKVLRVQVDEITYIEGLKNYIIIHTNTGLKHITYLTLNEVLEALPATLFYRIHKSYIINIRQIQSVEGNMVKLISDITLAVGVNYKENFMEVISQLTVRTKRK